MYVHANICIFIDVHIYMYLYFHMYIHVYIPGLIYIYTYIVAHNKGATLSTLNTTFCFELIAPSDDVI